MEVLTLVDPRFAPGPSPQPQPRPPRLRQVARRGAGHRSGVAGGGQVARVPPAVAQATGFLVASGSTGAFFTPNGMWTHGVVSAVGVR